MNDEPRAANAQAGSEGAVTLALDRDSFMTVLGPLKELLDHNMNMRILENIKLFAKLSKEDKDKICQSFSFEKVRHKNTALALG